MRRGASPVTRGHVLGCDVMTRRHAIRSDTEFRGLRIHPYTDRIRKAGQLTLYTVLGITVKPKPGPPLYDPTNISTAVYTSHNTISFRFTVHCIDHTAFHT